jgi:hypothetical protein
MNFSAEKDVAPSTSLGKLRDKSLGIKEFLCSKRDYK